MRTFSKLAGTLAFAAALALPAQAARNDGAMQERVKAALNEMVQDVKAAESPEAKREVMDRFLGKMERGAAVIERLPLLSEENRAALGVLQERFGGYAEELHGLHGKTPVPDGDLDAFASFMQQDLEQAQISGGVYLSVGAILIILLILLLLL